MGRNLSFILHTPLFLCACFTTDCMFVTATAVCVYVWCVSFAVRSCLSRRLRCLEGSLKLSPGFAGRMPVARVIFVLFIVVTSQKRMLVVAFILEDVFGRRQVFFYLWWPLSTASRRGRAQQACGSFGRGSFRRR